MSSYYDRCNYPPVYLVNHSLAASNQNGNTNRESPPPQPPAADYPTAPYYYAAEQQDARGTDASTRFNKEAVVDKFLRNSTTNQPDFWHNADEYSLPPPPAAKTAARQPHRPEVVPRYGTASPSTRNESTAYKERGGGSGEAGGFNPPMSEHIRYADETMRRPMGGESQPLPVLMDLGESPPRVHKAARRVHNEDYVQQRSAMLDDSAVWSSPPELLADENNKRRKASAFKSIRRFLKKHLRLSPSHRVESFDLGNNRGAGNVGVRKASASLSSPIFSPTRVRPQHSASSHNVAVNGGMPHHSLHQQLPSTITDTPIVVGGGGGGGGESKPGRLPLTRAHSFSSTTPKKAAQLRHRGEQERRDYAQAYGSPDHPDTVVTPEPLSEPQSNGVSSNRYYQRRREIEGSMRGPAPNSHFVNQQLVRKRSDGLAPAHGGRDVMQVVSSSRGDSTNYDANRCVSTAFQTPCLLGIGNHGNTCYMNAILQCLACLDRFAEFFVCQQFPSSSSANSIEGASAYITSTLALTLQSMWFNAQADAPCLRMLRQIEEANPHFQISHQQDAQESLIWLLDRIHEEIRGSQTSGEDHQDSSFANGQSHQQEAHAGNQHHPPALHSSSLNKSEEELASDALRRVTGHNNRSAIVELFRAQFRSSMECVSCGFHNLTFDPYMTVSLSVPQPAPRVPSPLLCCTVTFVPFYSRRELVRYKVSVGGGGDSGGRATTMPTRVSHVKTMIMEGSIGTATPECAIACQFSSNGLCHFLADDLQIVFPNYSHHDPYQQQQQLSGGRYPGERRAGLTEFTLVEVPYLNEQQREDLVVAIVTFVMGGISLMPTTTSERSPAGGSGAGTRRGQPFVVVLNRQWGYERIYRHIMDKGRFMFSKSYFPLHSDFRLLLQHSSEGVVFLDPTLTMPLYTESVSRLLSGRSGPTSSLKLIVEWEPTTAYEFLRTVPEHVLNDFTFFHKDEMSVEMNEEQRLYGNEQSAPISLLNLLHDYTKSEVVPDWRCPKCLKTSGRKELKFHSLPPVLVFHLKRFELLEDGAAKKLESRVKLPLESLDMSPYICNPDSRHGTLVRQHSTSLGQQQQHAPFPNGAPQANAANSVYDLVGVVHHFGERTNSGHYTATTRNTIDGRWRNFDDLRVCLVPEHEIRSSTNAYLLFYERRTQPQSNGHHNLYGSFFSQATGKARWFPYEVPEAVIARFEGCSKLVNTVETVAPEFLAENVVGSSTFYAASNNGDGSEMALTRNGNNRRTLGAGDYPKRTITFATERYPPGSQSPARRSKSIQALNSVIPPVVPVSQELNRDGRSMLLNTTTNTQVPQPTIATITTTNSHRRIPINTTATTQAEPMRNGANYDAYTGPKQSAPFDFSSSSDYGKVSSHLAPMPHTYSRY